MQTAFRMEELSAGYERNIIFENLNASIEQGKITTIIGPNGCGKSTLLKTMGRILKKEKGHVFLQDQDMQTLSTKEIAKRLAILSQSPSAPPQLKVGELISYGRYPHRKNVNRLSKDDTQMIHWAMEVSKRRSLSHVSCLNYLEAKGSEFGWRWHWRKKRKSSYWMSQQLI